MSLQETLGVVVETPDQIVLRRTLMDMCLESVSAGRMAPEDVPRQLALLLRKASGVDLPDVPAVELSPSAAVPDLEEPVEPVHRMRVMLLEPMLEQE
jgi:hypothetical protein